jgi:beta-lactamase regulating signal transducer with metallopeptidase domain
MHTFWEIIVSNSLVVTALAVAVALLGRMWKNPVGLHLLWVLVLLKLVTPPMVVVPVPLTVNLQPAGPEQKNGRQRIADRSSVDVATEDENASVDLSRQEHRGSDNGGLPRGVTPIDVASAVADQQGLSWLTVFTWTWVVGIALFASVQACRILRLRRLLRDAFPAPPTIRSMAEEISTQLGLRWTPEVLMVSVRLSPMVWWLGGKPRLVLPAALFAQLDATAQEAIVAHELAHIRRRDHWVRLLELTVSTLFWWHPVVWWTCRVLRELEEQCCDGMVLGALPHDGKAYATALVDTLEYLSERPMSLPPVATGANSLVSLSRRIKMLRNPAPVRPLTIGRLLLLLAVSVVPMAVAFAARTPPVDDRPRPGAPKQDQGQDSLAAQADKNQGTDQPAVAKPSETDGSAKDQKSENRQAASWQLDVGLKAPNLAPHGVQWAIFNKDPIPGFKAQIKKMQLFYQAQLARAAKQTAKDSVRTSGMMVQWDLGFKEVSGDRLYLLTSDNPHPLTSTEPGGKKWIVTKVAQMKGKPVCWSLPVEVKSGEKLKVTLSDDNVFDLGSAFDDALRNASSSPEERKKFEEWNKRKEEYKRTSWLIQLALRVPGAVPPAVPLAIFDRDPVPDFKSRTKDLQTAYREKLGRAENEAAKEEIRKAGMTAGWDGAFKEIPENGLSRLRFGVSVGISANGPAGKKWIVTKVVEIKGKPVCWCLPVEVKAGEPIKVSLSEDNMFDLGSAFDGALREPGPPK